MNHWITRGECGTPTYYVSVSPCVSLRRPVADARLSKNVGRVLRALPDLRCSLTRWVRSVRTSPGLISAPDPAHSRPRPSSAGAITTIISRIDCVHVDASVVLGVVVTHARAASESALRAVSECGAFAQPTGRGDAGELQTTPSNLSPPRWIPAFAGMTVVQRS